MKPENQITLIAATIALFGAAPVFRDETEVLVMKEEGLQ